MEARRLTKMALLTALLCISAYISFPLPFSPAMVTALTLVATLTGLWQIIRTNRGLYLLLANSLYIIKRIQRF